MKASIEMNLKPERNRVSDFSYTHRDVNEYLCKMLGEDFRRYRHHWAQAEKDLQIFNFPLFLVVETINMCNLKCIMCFRGKAPQEKPKVMSMEQYVSIIAEASKHSCPSLSLNWNNEPLLDPDLPVRVSMARNAGFLDTRINTNANLLTAGKSEALIDAGLTRLSVSIDASTADTYSKIRIGGNYNQVISNVNEFLYIRRQKRSKLPLLRCTFVLLRENEHELDAFIKQWGGKADYISVQSYVPHTLGKKDLKLHPNLISNTMEFRDITCSQPFERLVISAGGEVYPCCSPIGTDILLGNIHDSSLQEIWRSKTENNLRKMMKDRTWSNFPVCNQCLVSTFDSHSNNNPQ